MSNGDHNASMKMSGDKLLVRNVCTPQVDRIVLPVVTHFTQLIVSSTAEDE